MVAQPDSAAPERSLFGAEVALLVCGIAVIVVTTLLARSGDVAPWERSVFRATNDLPDALYDPVWAVMQFGSFWSIVVLGVGALAFRRFRLATGLAIAGISVYLLAELLKVIVARGRPAVLLTHVHIRGVVPTVTKGFPSGHASVACALAVIAWLWFGPRLRWTFIAAAVVVCFARVYVGAHLPLDVIGGAGMGIASGALVGLVLNVRHHGRLDRDRRLSPAR